jgi:hypothetical protein
MALATLASMAMCLWLVDHSPAFGFYMLPARFWELGLGSIVALALRSGYLQPRAMPIVRCAAMAIVLAVPLVADERGHPGWPALAVTVATALLIVPGLVLRENAALRPVVALGDRSYALYLVHWPLIAFANNAWLGTVPAGVDLAILVASLAWMELQYRLVEHPLRHMPVNARTLAILIAVPLLVLGGSALWLRYAEPAPDPARAYNFGLGQDCDLNQAFVFQAQCRTGSVPQMLVWGDSFAMQWVGGIAASSSLPIAQATRTTCGPFPGIAPANGAERSSGWAGRCADFNASVMSALTRAPRLRTVVLSSSLAQYLPGAEPGWQLYRAGAGVGPQDREAVLASLAHTVGALRAMGKAVVLIAPPPSAGFDVARCASRLNERKPVIDRPAGCDFSLAEYQRVRRVNLAFLAEVERRHIVPVYRFDQTLCHGGRCAIVERGTLLYRDAGHISVPGSVAIGRKLDLATQLIAIAR